MRCLPTVLLMLLLLGGCINLTPQQETMFYTPEPAQYITAEEIRALLPHFAVVADGVYKLVPRGVMPRAEWCNVFALDIMKPKGWDCKDFAKWAVEQVETEYAFGKAWNPGTGRRLGHMVNLFIDTDRKVVLYDAQTCQFTRQPVTNIVIF